MACDLEHRAVSNTIVNITNRNVENGTVTTEIPFAVDQAMRAFSAARPGAVPELTNASRARDLHLKRSVRSMTTGPRPTSARCGRSKRPYLTSWSGIAFLTMDGRSPGGHY